MTRALAALVALTLAAAQPVAAEPLAGPRRLTLNAGFPELLGIGYGGTFGDGNWRVHGDVGVLFIVNSLTVHLQRLLYGAKWIRFAAGLNLAGLWVPPIIGEYPTTYTDHGIGARLSMEVGAVDGINLVLEGGVQAWGNVKERDKDGYWLQPSLAVRIAF